MNPEVSEDDQDGPSITKILENANWKLQADLDQTLRLCNKDGKIMQEQRWPQVTVTKKKAENRKIERIIEILHPAKEETIEEMEVK